MMLLLICMLMSECINVVFDIALMFRYCSDVCFENPPPPDFVFSLNPIV